MGRIVIELTDRCNLRCRHCFSGRHGGRGWLEVTVLEDVLTEAHALGYEEIAYTGGEPTLHPAFPAIVEKTVAAGYQFGLVTNGWTFPRHCTRLAAHRPQMQGVTFSLDGASADTHDRLRGEGSFRRVLQAVSLCVASDILFAFNMVITRENRHEIEPMVELAGSLGSLGVRFGHLMPTGRLQSEGLALDWQEREVVEKTITELVGKAACTVALAPGHHTLELFPCGPLQDQEFNIDWRGNVGFCCHLSGQSEHLTGNSVVGNLTEQSLAELLGSLAKRRDIFRQEKRALKRKNALDPLGAWPCDYCQRHFDSGDRPVRLSTRLSSVHASSEENSMTPPRPPLELF